jgi:hypothetical protein
VLCRSAFPSVPVLGSAGSATARAALFVGFPATTTESDFSGSCITGYGSSPFRCGPAVSQPPAKPETSRFPCKELPHMPGSVTTPERQVLALSHLPLLPSVLSSTSASGFWTFRGSMAGLCAPLSTLRRYPREYKRMTRGPVWFAIPSLQETFTLYSLPVSPAH